MGPSLPIFPNHGFHTTTATQKTVAGRYRVTLDRSKPLTYEMAVRPEEIGTHKSWNSANTGQLEGTLGYKVAGREMGQSLSSKLFIEDMFMRKFLKGTWSAMFLSEIIIKRQHNTIRISALMH